MTLPVDVKSIDVLTDFRADLLRFIEDCKGALAATDMEIRRAADWLANDQRLYWQAEIRRRRELVSQAKSELHRKRTSQMFGQQADMGEQKQNLREAILRLEEAEAKLEKVRAWVPQLQQAVFEYLGQARPLADMLDGELQRALMLLTNMIGALEDYVRIAAPATPRASTSGAAGATSAAPVATPTDDEAGATSGEDSDPATGRGEVEVTGSDEVVATAEGDESPRPAEA